MMFPGERFIVPLDDHDNDNDNSHENPSSSASLGVIGEIRERQPTSTPPPPKPPSGTTGFPQHKQRTRARQSAFKQRRDLNQSSSSSSAATQSQPPRSTNETSSTTRGITVDDEKKAIDEQNRQQLESWSGSRLQEERAELMESMDSSLLQRFLRRATIDDDVSSSTSGSNRDTTADTRENAQQQQQRTEKPSQSSQKHVSFNIPEQSPSSDDFPPTHPPEDLHPASQPIKSTTAVPFHFPKPPPHQNPLPNLDPSSPSFLSDLQTHYFPDLPHNPSTISWLQPPPSDPEDPESSISPYHPSSTLDSVSPSAIRFSLLGTMLSPKTSLSLPTTLGLHHHGHDPHAAGYTIPELAILGRSSFPAQRCVAWQVLGRILFRLGKGQFGIRGSVLVEGLWNVIEHEGVVSRMLVEADGGGGGGGGAGVGLGKHASASAWAVEGVWLWRMGGGGDRGLLKEGTVRSQ